MMSHMQRPKIDQLDEDNDVVWASDMQSFLITQAGSVGNDRQEAWNSLSDW